MQLVPSFSYIDELIPVFLFFYLIFFERRILINNSYLRLIILFILFSCYLCVPTLIFKIQSDSLVYFKDFWAFTKFFSVSLLLIQIFKRRDLTNELDKLANHSKIWLIIILFFGLLSQVINLGMTLEYSRFGIKSYQFIFSHPTFLVFSIISLYLIIFASNVRNKNTYTLITILSLLLTGRSKAVIFIIILLFILLSQKIKFKKIRVSRYFSILLLSFFIFYLNLSKIKLYLSAAVYSARPLLYMKLPQILIDTKGLGYGLGTYGTHISGEYYSQIYFRYKLQYIQGLTMNDYRYIGDTFWPSLIGQFGILGTIIFLVLLYRVFCMFYFESKLQKNKLALILITSYLIIGSFVESIFINSSGAFFPILMAFIAYNRRCNENIIDR